MLNTFIRILLFTGTFLLSLGIGLVVFMPLSFVLSQWQKAQPSLRIEASQGTWWNGSLQGVSWQQLKQADLAWQLDLEQLWAGKIVSQMQVKHPALEGSAQIGLPLRLLYSANQPSLSLSAGQFKVDIAQLTPFAPYPLPEIQGQLTLFVEQLELNLAQLQDHALPIIALQPALRFATSKIQVLDGIDIGRYQGSIVNSTSPLGYRLALDPTSSPFAVSGHSLLTHQTLRSDYLVDPSNNADPRLIKLLDLMGQKLQHGGYRFNTAYSL